MFAINNDCICPLFDGDNTRYIYTGSVGKVLPCFYILGKETHVRQYFEGYDSSLAAAELVKQIDSNCDLCDGYKAEYTLPPTVLKVKDLKRQYNVQTACSSFVYFNLIPQIIVELKAGKTDMRDISLGAVEKLCENVRLEKPVIIIFFAPPYCPHNTLRSDNPGQRKLYNKLDLIIRDFESKSNDKFQIKQYFQSLSDSSYLSIDDNNELIKALVSNSPAPPHMIFCILYH